MPKARPPFDVERYTSLKDSGISQRQIAKALGMAEATLRNNLKVLGIKVETGVPARGTQVSQGTLSQTDLVDLQGLLVWWRQRQAHADHGPLVRHTFHVDTRWLEAIRREADVTKESYAAVLNRALAAYFAGKST